MPATMRKKRGARQLTSAERKLQRQAKARKRLEEARAAGIRELAHLIVTGGQTIKGQVARQLGYEVHAANIPDEPFILTDEEVQAVYEEAARIDAMEAQRRAAWAEEERRQAAEAEKLAAERRKAWATYLKQHGLEGNLYARILADTLADPTKAHIDWFREAMAALEANCLTGGQAWQAFKDGELTYRDIVIAIKAYRRHAYTDYDDMLASGVDRDAARVIIEWE